MRGTHGTLAAIAALTIAAPVAVRAQDASQAVAGGGISVAGWRGQIDANEAKSGQKLENAKFAPGAAKGALHVTTGPAGVYWHPSNRASGNYTVKATFREPKFMGLNNHAHPYGLVIAGNDMGTAQQSYLYCAAYGDGRYIVRGFGPESFQLNGRRGDTTSAVNKAAGTGQAVTQEIAMSVKGDRVECAINGKTVASYPKADLVTAGKLKSTDGMYGIRMGHNTEAVVTGLTMTKQ